MHCGGILGTPGTQAGQFSQFSKFFTAVKLGAAAAAALLGQSWWDLEVPNLVLLPLLKYSTDSRLLLLECSLDSRLQAVLGAGVSTDSELLLGPQVNHPIYPWFEDDFWRALWAGLSRWSPIAPGR